MGLFNGYMKEGKGVEKDAPKPIRPVYFFELFFRKFWKMIQLNLLFIVTTIPFWAILYFIGNFLIAGASTTDKAFLNSITTFAQIVANPITLIALVLISFLLGPSTAGATYILTNYANEMPVFLCSDYFENFKKNFKQSSLLMIINVVATLSTLITWIIPLVPDYSSTMNMKIFYFIRYPSLIVMVLLIFINFYANSIMVMFDMKFSDIMKNSILFALGRLPWNVLTLAIIGGITYLAIMNFAIGIILIALILYSLCGFIVVFSVYPTIEKYMLIPAKEQQAKKEEDKNE